MGNPFEDQFESLGKTAYETAKEFETIGARLIEQLAEHQWQVAYTCLETGAKQLSLVTESKDYKELLTAQTKLATEYNEKVLSSARKTTEILNDARTQFTSWVEKYVANVVNNSKVAATAFTPKAI